MTDYIGLLLNIPTMKGNVQPPAQGQAQTVEPMVQIESPMVQSASVSFFGRLAGVIRRFFHRGAGDVRQAQANLAGRTEG